jgi:hypothetical protein
VKSRLVAGVAVLAVVLALVGLAVVAGRDSGTRTPATLPVLGAGGRAGAGVAAPTADAMRIAPTRYEAGKLPGLAEEADAWKLPAATSDRGAVAELAKTLGVDGQVTTTGSGWSVGTDARRLDVQAVAGMPWSLYESVPDASVSSPPAAGYCTGECGAGPGTATTMACPPNAACVPPSPPVTDPGACAADACGQPMEPTRPADLPSKADAEVLGRKVLAELGIDLGTAAVHVDDSITVWNVVADPVVGGLPTVGFTTSVGIGPNGVVQYANGWLGEPTGGDRYPLIGTAAGVQRLDDQQTQIMIGRPSGELPCQGCDPGSTEPRVVRVTGVRLGLQVFSTFERGAAGYLVPTYLFSTDDGGEIPVVAVADRYLGQQPAPVEEKPGTPAEPGSSGCAVPAPAAPDPTGPPSCGGGASKPEGTTR